MRIATLAFFVRENAVLLGEKKSGAEIGSGKLNGAGGKLEPDETIFQCLVRETDEEFGVNITEAQKIAVLSCFAADVLFQEVHVYLVTKWEDEPVETESMFLPEWYADSQLPFERMHEADTRWLPRALRALNNELERFNAHIFYREPGKGFERIEFSAFSE